MNVPKQPGVKGYWQPGRQLYHAKYTIEKDLGCGGFGVTYLARDKKSQQVVIKTLNKDAQLNPLFEKLRQNFLNEAIRLAKCSHHPHIVQIIELFEEERLPCIVMEYIRGENLATWVEQRNLEEAEAIYYIRQIALALDAVHQQGFLHRDVKPHNIMIAADGSKAVLIDFGIAREYKQDTLTTLTTFISGGYSPIEQHYPKEKQAPYTDIYSLAATLYFVLTKRNPQNAQTRHYNLTQYGIDPLIAPKQINSNISEQVNTAVLQGMAVQPEARPQNIKTWLVLLPDIKILPKHKMKNPTHYSESLQPTLPIKSASYEMSSFWTRQFYLFLWGCYLSACLIHSPMIYGAINGSFLKNYVSSIFRSKNNLTYGNQNYSFKLEYSKSWVLSQRPSRDFTQKVAELLSQRRDSSNSSFGKILIEVRELGKTRSLTEVKQETIEDIKRWFANSKIVENRKTFLGGKPAYLLVYQGVDNGQKIRRMRVATVKNNREYALIYEADIRYYEMRKKSAQQIINSFDWLKS